MFKNDAVKSVCFSGRNEGSFAFGLRPETLPALFLLPELQIGYLLPLADAILKPVPFFLLSLNGDAHDGSLLVVIDLQNFHSKYKAMYFSSISLECSYILVVFLSSFSCSSITYSTSSSGDGRSLREGSSGRGNLRVRVYRGGSLGRLLLSVESAQGKMILFLDVVLGVVARRGVVGSRVFLSGSWRRL